MTGLLRGLVFRRLGLERGRSASLALGTALGVATLVAAHALEETTLDRLGRLGEVATSGAGVLIEGGPGGVPAALASQVEDLPGVVVAYPVIARFARDVPSRGDERPRRVLVVGIDLLDPAVRKGFVADEAASIDRARLVTRTDAAVLAAELARRRGLSHGGRLELFLPGGRASLLVAGTYSQQASLASTLGGDVVVVRLETAMALFGTPGRADRIALRLEPTADVARVVSAVAAAVGPGFSVRTPGQQDARAAMVLGSTRLALKLASLLALVIATFLVSNAAAVALARRRPELGTLRALGATRSHLVSLVLCEAFTLGAVGSLIGTPLGLLVARAALGVVSSLTIERVGALEARGLVVSLGGVALGLVAGPLATVLASIPGTLDVLRVSPLEATRREPPGERSARRPRRLALFGAGLLVVAGSLLFNATPGIVNGALLAFALLGGFAALAPWAVRGLLLARGLVSRTLGPAGALALEALTTRPGRAGGTVAALLVALGGVLGMATVVGALETAVRRWVDSVLAADLYAVSGAPMGGPSAPLLSPQVARELLAIPGVARVVPVRFVLGEAEESRGSGLARGTPVLVVATTLGPGGLRGGLPVLEAIPEGAAAALRELRGDDAIAVSSNLARRRGVKPGDRLALRTARGLWEPRVVIVFLDFTSEHGSVFLDTAQFVRRWDDDRVSSFDLACRPGASPEEVRATAERIRADLGPKYDLFVTESATYRARILRAVESTFAVTYALQLVAIGVALLSVLATLQASVIERTGELATLRAVGADRSFVVRLVAIEGALLGLVAGLLATPAGAAVGFAFLRLVEGAFGWELAFAPPVLPPLFGAVGATVLAALAGVWPGRRAASLEIARVLA